MKTLGERIRELREAKDLSLREFAKKLGGLSAAFLSDVELGRRHPSDAVLADMARVLGTTVADLKQHDSRPPVEELKRLSSADPAFGFAFRKLVDKDVSPEELMKFLEKHPDRRKRKE
ncbi:MAG: helix-turn-helix transcriptional regulator [Chloroflexi bacterium]|nr:helix-turn-helix transcriptional regulator [Chloroflexota bacterium]